VYRAQACNRDVGATGSKSRDDRDAAKIQADGPATGRHQATGQVRVSNGADGQDKSPGLRPDRAVRVRARARSGPRSGPGPGQGRQSGQVRPARVTGQGQVRSGQGQGQVRPARSGPP
jgi:hypothetical protein